MDAGIKKSELTQALGENIILELARGLKDLRVGLEGDLGTGLLRIADNRHLLRRFALGKTHLVDLAVPAHFGDEPFRDGVDALGADTVQTAGDLVGALAELTAGVKIGKYQFQCRDVVLRVDIDRNASAVVLD